MSGSTKKKPENDELAASETAITRPKCGIVMPISAIENCGEAHWQDVYHIIKAATEAAGFDASMVSNTNEVAFIHNTIVQNLYDNPIVVCDVSCKNPNVMFELGIRLTFDKPTIIIKDDKTPYSFDTSPVEHLEYPRDLRFNRIVEFQSRLTEKLKATYKKASDDPNYSTFLKHFGEFITPKIDKKEVSGQEYIISRLDRLDEAVRQLGLIGSNPRSPLAWTAAEVDTCSVIRTLLPDYLLKRLSKENVRKVANHIKGCKECESLLISLEAELMVAANDAAEDTRR
jgi:hypothetical protein